MDIAQLARQVPRRREAPSGPWAPPAACLVAALVLLGLGRVGGLAGEVLLVAPISVAALGLVLAIERVEERRRARAAADAWIARGYVGPASRYAWRIDELTCWRERKLLGGSVRSIVPELVPGRLPSASPINRAALRPHRSLLVSLADRLDDMARPVSAAGVLAVHRLLTDCRSCLYAHEDLEGRAPDVARELITVLDRLEVRR